MNQQPIVLHDRLLS